MAQTRERRDSQGRKERSYLKIRARLRTPGGEFLQPYALWWTRVAGALAVLAALAWYYGVSEDLPTLGLWADVVFLSFGLIPLTFVLVLIALPLRQTTMERLGWAAIAL